MNRQEAGKKNTETVSVAKQNEVLRLLRIENEEALHLVYQMSGIREFKIAHLLLRVRCQLIRGTWSEKKQFFQWIFSLMDRETKKELNLQYNPLYKLLPHLNEVQKQAGKLAGMMHHMERAGAGSYSEADLSEIDLPEDHDFLQEKYTTYDVIILGMIDYQFRFQRPQHIADAYAAAGHRVFYINDLFSKTSTRVEEKRDNLCIVKLPCVDTLSVTAIDSAAKGSELYPEIEKLIVDHGIRDAVLVVDFPGWVNTALELRTKYGFPIVSNYMDDYTSFAEFGSGFLKRCSYKLLEKSDVVVTSSLFLQQKAKRFNSNVELIRNGTEFAHFYSAFCPDHKKERKTIGYVGAIAEWFDDEKVEYLAKRFPEYEIVLIGNVTNSKVLKWKYSNVQLLGEKPYAVIPEYLRTMDVCIIPFKTDNDLIQATNPVKFYEYLSAGKKIVATEIPELMPFKDRFAYLENENEAFAACVQLCMEKKDELASPDECFAFARENDWENRTKAFMKASESAFEKISIIILCYNQLEYTKKCVASILENTAYPNYEIILVDNASEDGTAAYLHELAQEYSNIVPVYNTKNRGFAGGNNDGIDASSGKYIVLLNNDTIVTRGWLTAMRKHLKNNENAGIVGAVTNSIGNEAMIPVEYEDLKDLPQFAYDYTARNMNRTYSHDGVLAMFCVMFRRNLTDIVGKLDENYGIGMFEDDDYSYAALEAGLDLVLPEDVFIHHFGSASFNCMGDDTRRKLFEKNKAYFEQKWVTTWREHHYREETAEDDDNDSSLEHHNRTKRE